MSNGSNLILAPTATAVLQHVVRSIVDDPDAVSVDAREDDDKVYLEVRVGAGDLGRVIGRRGRTAQSIRTVVRAAVIHRFKDAVRIGGKAAIGEEHRLDPLAQLFVREEQQAFAAGIAFCHRGLLHLGRIYVSLVDFPRHNC